MRSSVNLSRNLSTVFGGHNSLNVLHDARYETSVVIELLRTIGDLDSCLLADELVMGAFINVPDDLRRRPEHGRNLPDQIGRHR